MQSLDEEVIYQAYKPDTLEDVKNYTKYILNHQPVTPNEVDEIVPYFPLPSQTKEPLAKLLSEGLRSYMNKQYKSNLYS
jgi:hypothetical protein